MLEGYEQPDRGIFVAFTPLKAILMSEGAADAEAKSALSYE